MTWEQALKLLEYPIYKWSMDWDEREDGLDYAEAIEIAIAALRHQIWEEQLWHDAKTDPPKTPGSALCAGMRRTAQHGILSAGVLIADSRRTRIRREHDGWSHAIHFSGFLALGWDGYPSICTQPQNYYK